MQSPFSIIDSYDNWNNNDGAVKNLEAKQALYDFYEAIQETYFSPTTSGIYHNFSPWLYRPSDQLAHSSNRNCCR
jgi:hypothetical protein